MTPPSPQLDIICLGTSEWLLVRSVAHYTATGFAETNRVLYVEPFASWVSLARLARLQNRVRDRKPRIEQVGPTLWVYRPPAIALPGVGWFGWVSDLNNIILAFLLKGVMKKIGFGRPIVWSFLYNSASFLRHFQARLRIYECADYDAALAPTRRRRRLVLAHEAACCRAADLVFAVTQELAALLAPHSRAVHEVNCAAAPEVFSRALQSETTVPADIAALPHPVIGYMGGVDPWKIDVPLLLALARAHPEWSIALVGYVWFGFDPGHLRVCANIHVLGPKEYHTFPGYLKGMDVCIMPFPLNENTRNGDALKLYEYLAAGKPVVSTPVPAARRLASVVRIAESQAEFLAATEAALNDTPERQAERLAAVQPHSWAARNRQKLQLILAALKECHAHG